MGYIFKYDEIKDFDFPFELGEDTSKGFTKSCSINGIPFNSSSSNRYRHMWYCFWKQSVLGVLPPDNPTDDKFDEPNKYYILNGRFQLIDKLDYSEQLYDNWKYYVQKRYAANEKVYYGVLIDDKYLELPKQFREPIEYRLEPDERFCTRTYVEPPDVGYNGYFVYVDKLNPTHDLEVLYKFYKYPDYPLSLQGIYVDNFIY